MALHEQMWLGDVPDEYLDPIPHTLIMLDVAQLPSGHIVNRTMIERHLLSARVDPFNREPLTLEMLQTSKPRSNALSKLSPSAVGPRLGRFEQATAPNYYIMSRVCGFSLDNGDAITQRMLTS
ncbi:Aste57867_20874 [Aphanomyces stellatus]|uniref:Aste57867_20874 protein n=1 Tax=Aphanomyces stellatus TaxID=120398 RepID=A0A485LGS6_9STRA|nr:hypothetical protein As57867_020806 [Aphanomyces stellatus]VFT97551.1 Aste57867_20874 [Aphanomyces stellatus]